MLGVKVGTWMWVQGNANSDTITGGIHTADTFY